MNNKLKYALVILGIVVVWVVLALLGVQFARYSLVTALVVFLNLITTILGILRELQMSPRKARNALAIIIGLIVLICWIIGYLKKRKKAQQ